MKKAIYVRVSNSIQTELMETLIEKIKKENNIAEAMVFSDIASGQSLERSALKRLVESVKRKEIDFVAIEKLQHLATDQNVLLKVFDVFGENQVTLVCQKKKVYVEDAFFEMNQWGR